MVRDNSTNGLTATPPTIQVECDPNLMQDVVFQEINRREKDGDSSLFNEYHKSADPIYEKFPLEKREAEFEKLNRRFFRKMSFGDLILKSLAEFPVFKDTLEQVLVKQALTRGEEGADLSKDLKSLGLKILTRRLLAPADLQKLLSHELTHVSDMLDSDFGYVYMEKLNVQFPAEENLIRDRYKVLWDIYIDSRLAREKKPAILDKEGRYREFEVLYGRIPTPQRSAIFDDLWQMEKQTHHQLLELARDTGKLLNLVAGRPGIEEVPSRENILLPGSPCPLCRFPTCNWANELDRLEENIIGQIKQDFPGWRIEDGACERCIEVYEVRQKQCR